MKVELVVNVEDVDDDLTLQLLQVSEVNFHSRLSEQPNG